MVTQASSADDEMPGEVDFSTGTRGRFYQPESAIQLPVYLAPRFRLICQPAPRPGASRSPRLINALLRKDIELIEAAR